MSIALDTKAFVSPYEELLALELLYSKSGMSLKDITDITVKSGSLPSQALKEIDGFFIDVNRKHEIELLLRDKLGSFSIVVNNTPNWPEKLRDSARPAPVIYYRGDLSWIDKESVSIVGARKASETGKRRAAKLAKELSEHNIAVVTGLAKGIDTAAAESAIRSGGEVIGVIGTPVDEAYPKENKELQDIIADRYLLISQVPFYRYSTEPFKSHKYRFPERNELMAAISDITVIVEASDTSGTRSQAKACIDQKRPLFIMKSLLDNEEVEWPKKIIKNDGVFVLEDTSQILDMLSCKHY